MLEIKKKRRWSPEDIQEIRDRYQTSYIKDLAKKFGVLPRQLTAVANYYGIKRSPKPWKIRKVHAEESILNPFHLVASKERIGELMLAEKDFTKAKKLEAIYKSMNEAIKKSL